MHQDVSRLAARLAPVASVYKYLEIVKADNGLQMRAMPGLDDEVRLAMEAFIYTLGEQRKPAEVFLLFVGSRNECFDSLDELSGAVAEMFGVHDHDVANRVREKLVGRPVGTIIGFDTPTHAFTVYKVQEAWIDGV